MDKILKPVTQNRTALVSNEVFEKNRYNLNLNAQKVLFGLAQGIDHSINMFEEFEIDIRGLFAYLGVDGRGDRYEVVRQALSDITKNPLEYKSSDKKWSGIPWLSYSYDESQGMYVKIAFTDKVKPFLHQMSGYVKLKGKYICDLSSTYATWLYPLLKITNEKYRGTHIVPVQRLKEITFTDDPVKCPGYNTSKTANRDFLKRCLGVSKGREDGQWKIDEKGPLAEINRKTDIIVSVEVLKDGKKYDRVKFMVSKKESEKRSSKNDPLPGQYDMFVPKSKGGNAFGRGLKAKQTITKTIPMTEVYSYATAAEMSVEAYLKMAGYYQKGDRAYKKDL